MIDLSTMLSALESDPQTREAIRREILTEELLAPSALIEARLAELAGGSGRDRSSAWPAG